MKHTVLMAAVVAMVLATAAQTTAAQEDEESSLEEIEQDLERREIELEIQRLEDDAEVERQERQFDLEERQLELEQRRAEIDRISDHDPDHHKDDHGFLILLIIITNILLTVWVFKDMNEKKIGRALWVPIVLLAGVFGAILYAIVRLADAPKST